MDAPPAAHSVPTTLRRIELNDGRAIPQLGYGVWQLAADECADLVVQALEAGYRHVDTATIYANEEGVGAALRRSGQGRDDVFVTTKLWNDDQGFESALAAFDRSSELLGLDEIDLYLVHWPSPVRGDAYIDSWRALVQLKGDGRARSIGVSNHQVHHLERIADATGVVPAVNQIELHPYFQQRDLVSAHRQLGIATEAWSPLGQGGTLLADPTLAEIAAELRCTPAQVVLAWHIASGFVVIPKSATPARIVENAALDTISLTDSHLQRIAALDRGPEGRIGPDPDTAQF